MSEKSHAANVASFDRRGQGHGRGHENRNWGHALQLVILAIILLSMHILPVSIGHAAPSGHSVSLH